MSYVNSEAYEDEVTINEVLWHVVTHDTCNEQIITPFVGRKKTNQHKCTKPNLICAFTLELL